MNLRTDYGRAEHVPFESVPWVSSPEPGVERKMLERDGGEVARATSIVRYAPGSAFAEHVHARGEEFVVLEGTFEDEHGSYPPSTYVRNPPGSRHSPFSRGGCTIFVKLRQFAEDDGARVVVRNGDGLRLLEGKVPLRRLHAHRSERVDIVDLAARDSIAFDEPESGTELLVLGGSMTVQGVPSGPRAWLRVPGALGRVRSDEGATLWVKRGHLVDLRRT